MAAGRTEPRPTGAGRTEPHSMATGRTEPGQTERRTRAHSHAEPGQTERRTRARKHPSRRSTEHRPKHDRQCRPIEDRRPAHGRIEARHLASASQAGLPRLRCSNEPSRVSSSGC